MNRDFKVGKTRMSVVNNINYNKEACWVNSSKKYYTVYFDEKYKSWCKTGRYYNTIEEAKENEKSFLE